MGKALYRKYRSRSLDEIVGQEHITTTLKHAINADSISHAYLFTGPRGVGKTSIARILAHEINQLPYEDESTHLDIIEIDAASNRRIDEIRDLRERVHIAPTSSKYKVYIIDEVHMLTKEAFNALLKTLEEPPAHAVFILATTEAHKLPDTIISRTQRFTFKPVPQDKVVAHLKSIAKEEGFSIDDEGMKLLASHGGGSFRDSISMLDQSRGHGNKVSLHDVQQLLGIAPDELIASLIEMLSGGAPADVITYLETIRDQGYQAGQIAKQIAEAVRTQLITGQRSLGDEAAVALLDKLLGVPSAHDQHARLELILIEFVLHGKATSPQPAAEKTQPAATKAEKVDPAPSSKSSKKTATEVEVEQKKEAESQPKTTKTSKSTDQPQPKEFDIDAWQQALENLKQTNNTLYSVARMAEAAISGNELTLTFGFAFHQKRINETKNKQIISDVLESVTGSPVVITCLVGKVSSKPKELSVQPAATTTEAQPDSLAAISNIFGSAEVLES